MLRIIQYLGQYLNLTPNPCFPACLLPTLYPLPLVHDLLLIPNSLLSYLHCYLRNVNKHWWQTYREIACLGHRLWYDWIVRFLLTCQMEVWRVCIWKILRNGRQHQLHTTPHQALQQPRPYSTFLSTTCFWAWPFCGKERKTHINTILNFLFKYTKKTYWIKGYTSMVMNLEWMALVIRTFYFPPRVSLLTLARTAVPIGTALLPWKVPHGGKQRVPFPVPPSHEF